MAYVSLEDDFHSNPKVLAAGLDGAGLYARALSYCGAHLTDGFVPKEWLKQAATGRKAVIGKCVAAGLMTEAPGGYSIRDYLEHNPSREQVLKRREERSKSGKAGAKKRWTGRDKSYGNSHGASNGESHSDSDSSDLANEWHRSPSPTSELEEKGEEGSSIGKAVVNGDRATPDFEPDHDLIPETELAMIKLASEVRGVSDVQTQVNVIRSLYGGKLPAAAFYAALESTRKTPTQHIGYAMKTLRLMVEEHQYG